MLVHQIKYITEKKLSVRCISEDCVHVVLYEGMDQGRVKDQQGRESLIKAFH